MTDKEKLLNHRNEQLENQLNDSNELCNQQALRITDMEEEVAKLKEQIEKIKKFLPSYIIAKYFPEEK